MKQCPDCGTRNQRTNIFCPICGFSWLEGPGRPSLKPEKAAPRHRRSLVVAIIVVVLLLMVAALVSVLATRRIESGKDVMVETGTIWKCGTCGMVYKRRVTRRLVKKAEVDKYSAVRTVEGTCYFCEYGTLVGKHQEALDLLSDQGLFHAYKMEIMPPAAQFMKDHPDLFPASGEEALSSIQVEESPKLNDRDLGELTGRPVHIRGRVVSSKEVETGTGSGLTFFDLQAYVSGSWQDVHYLVFSLSMPPLPPGEFVDCYLLPVDFLEYSEGGQSTKAVLAVAMFMEGGLPHP